MARSLEEIQNDINAALAASGGEWTPELNALVAEKKAAEKEVAEGEVELPYKFGTPTGGTSTNPAPTKEKQSNQFKESQVAKMTAQQFEKNEEAIMSAIRSGDFIYDVSRPAT